MLLASRLSLQSSISTEIVMLFPFSVTIYPDNVFVSSQLLFALCRFLCDSECVLWLYCISFYHLWFLFCCYFKTVSHNFTLSSSTLVWACLIGICFGFIAIFILNRWKFIWMAARYFVSPKYPCSIFWMRLQFETVNIEHFTETVSKVGWRAGC